ncbi:MAG: hypothetical protein COA84_10810 [Robiginitomaculum sp.]|nr:MAG: hypothetical protein COA84_10810 [Robiginitomaculum sp.]
MFVRALLSAFILSFLSVGAWAQSEKISLEGRNAERAAAGGRVRVVVDYAIPAQDMPVGAKALAARRDLIAAQRDDLLERAFGKNVGRYEQARKLTTFDGPQVVRPLDNVPSMAMVMTREEMEKLAADPSVLRIFSEKPMRVMLDVSTVLVGAPVVWSAGSDGADFAVAVLDTGSDHEHIMTTGKVVGSACFSTTDATQNSVSLCPNNTNIQISAPAGKNCPVDDLATTDITEGVDGCNHGTHVASTAMGSAFTLSSGRTIQGVARGANLVAVQVFTKFTDPADCDEDGTPPDPASAPCVASFPSDQRAGLDYVLSNASLLKIASVNMSLGGGKSTAACDTGQNAAMKSLIDQLRTAGVATVIASGNESFTDGVSNPGCISSAVTVGATSKQDVVAGFSNSSPLVDLLAPGVSILAAYPKTGGINYAVPLSGTSMATPHVAGAFALLRSAHPTATIQEIEDALKATGKPILDGRNLLYKPRIRVDLASALLANGGGAGIGEVAIAPAEGYFSIGEPGKSATFGNKTYTLTNNSSASINWTVSADKSFILLNKASGTLAAGASDTVIVTIDGNALAGGGSGSDDGAVTFAIGPDTAVRSVGATANFLANNDFADALPLSGLQPSTSGSSLGADKEIGEPNHEGGTNAGGASVWYKWTAPLSSTVQISTVGSDFDTVLGVYTGTSVSALTAIANNDDVELGVILDSKVTFPAVKGTIYYIAVDGFNGASGNIQLAIGLSGAVGNDTFASAISISGASGSADSHSVNATAETGEPAHAGTTAANSIWFDWTAPSSGDFAFNTDGSDFDTVMAVYTGSAVGALTEVASNDNQGVSGTASNAGPAFTSGASQLSFTATLGTVYHIAVDGKSGATGLVNLGWASTSTALPNLLTAVLPYARSVKVGTQATAFMTVFNLGTVQGNNCSISLSPGAFEGGFTYQTTDVNNVASGSPDTPINILPGVENKQNFVFAISPSTVFSQQELGLQANCDEGTSSNVIIGVNSFILSSAESIPLDMIVVGLTGSNDGFLSIPGAGQANVATLATSSIGGGGILTLSVDDNGKGLPLILFVCETDLAVHSDGACLATPVGSYQFNSANGENRTFTVFANATGDIPTDPANTRIFIRFKDANGVVRGATNFAIRTDAP